TRATSEGGGHLSDAEKPRGDDERSGRAHLIHLSVMFSEGAKKFVNGILRWRIPGPAEREELDPLHAVLAESGSRCTGSLNIGARSRHACGKPNGTDKLRAARGG